MRTQTARPLLSRFAFVCLWFFAFSMPLEKSLYIPGFGSGSKLAGFFALAAGVLAIAVHGRFRIPGPVQLTLTVMVLWSAFTLRWTLSEPSTIELVTTYVQLLSLMILIWEFCDEERHILSLLGAYVIGTIVPAADTLQRFLMHQQTYYNRYATDGFDPNDLALTLALMLPMAYYLTLKQTGWMTWIYRLHMLLSIGTIFLTASRGGTLCMIIGLSLLVTTFHVLPARQRAAVIALGVLSTIAAVALVPTTTWTRLGTAASEVSQGTLNSRTVLWRAGLTAFQNSPFEGVGAGAYPETSAKVMGRPWNFVAVAHNSFISILVETGLIGFSIFAFLLFQLFRMALNMPGITRTFWLTTLAVWMVGICSLTWEYRKPTWLIFGLLATHAARLPQAAAAATRPVFQRKRYFNTARVASGVNY